MKWSVINEQSKIKRIQEQTIEELENEINQYLASEEGRRYELLNVSIDKIEERHFLIMKKY